VGVTVSDSPTAHPWRPGPWDVVLGLVVVALGVRVLSQAGGGEGFRAADLLAYALTAVGCATTAWARRQPLAALIVAGLLATVLVAWDYHADLLPFVITGLLFMTASYRSSRGAVTGLAATALCLTISAATRPPDLGAAALAQTTAVLGSAWVLGRLVRGRRTALVALLSEAEHRAVVERELAAAERDQGKLALVEERLRIARDLHDVLAHSMSVISVQATVGQHLAAEDPSAARRALVTISDVTRSSMQDLRQMLTVLRDDSSAGPPDAVSYEPAHGVESLESLLDSFRAAGLAVITTTSGLPRELSGSADLCAYRIIQEALTNTLKHAAAGTATVGLRYEESAVQVVVADDGVGLGVASATDGHGLVGMRERTALLGGRLVAGPAPGGGFTVTATIPYERDIEQVTR
jgi:signal transduction histidine kinase